jgi:hypothetical protein
MEDTELQKVIVTVGDLIRVLQEYNLTAKIVLSTQGSYADVQISRDDIGYLDKDTEDTVCIDVP